jgi:hypothetical protein
LPWINLDDIDLKKFIQGDYIPPNYFSPLTRIDLRYLFPNREYELAINLISNETVKDYISDHRESFSLPKAVDISQWDVEKSAYMPGPGNRRPTNSILRYIVKGEPSFAYVAKVGNYQAGRVEFVKQKQLYEMGFPTPRPFYWENGAFTNFFKGLHDFLTDKFKKKEISAEDYNRTKQLFDSIVNEDEELYVIKNKLNQKLFDDKTGDHDEAEMIQEFYKGKKLQFASILWMEFKLSVSFEVLLYNLLGGQELDTETGTIEIIPAYETTILPQDELITKIPALLNQLWKITTHNDLKGEHIRFDQTNNANQFIMIDWGTGGGGTIEYIPRDLGILLYDVTSYIIERTLFSRKFKYKLQDPRAQAIEHRILSYLEDFWYQFLNNVDPLYLSTPILTKILHFLESKQESNQEIYVKDAISALKRIAKR